MNQEVEKIIGLGKDAIVQLALELIDERAGVQNFSKINVTTDGTTVYVSFLNPIKYLPMNSVFYFDFGVDLIEEVISSGPVSNGIVESGKTPPIYKQSKETKLIIQFVIEAINESDEMSPIDVTNFEDEMTIREHENHYGIIVVSEVHESSFKIEKISGRIYDVVNAPIAPLPVFEDDNKREFKEIN